LQPAFAREKFDFARGKLRFTAEIAAFAGGKSGFAAQNSGLSAGKRLAKGGWEMSIIRRFGGQAGCPLPLFTGADYRRSFDSALNSNDPSPGPFCPAPTTFHRDAHDDFYRGRHCRIHQSAD
jgi:hypothetical protein